LIDLSAFTKANSKGQNLSGGVTQALIIICGEFVADSNLHAAHRRKMHVISKKTAGHTQLTGMANKVFTGVSVALMKMAAAALTALLVWQCVLWWLLAHYVPLASDAAWVVAQSSGSSSAAWPTVKVPQALAGSFETLKKQPVAAQQQELKAAPNKVMSVAQANIRVEGIVVALDANKSRAILSVPGFTKKVFSTGDLLSDQMRLKKITAQALWVQRNGQIIELRFAKLKLAELNAGLNTASKTVSIAADNVGQAHPNEPVIAISAVLKQQLIQNPMQMGKYIIASPDFKNGQMQGYRLRKGRESEVFENSGFKDNDTITHIEGIHVSQWSASQLLGGGILSRNTIPITIIRNGASIALEVQIK
jgi:type II secretion system protein C